MSRLFRDVEGGPLCPQGSVVCIGAFDGLHLGHRALVRHAVARARSLGLTAVALSFEPLPREFLGATPPSRLTPRRDKVDGLFALGIDVVGLLRFNTALSKMTPDMFIRAVLVQRLHAREVWVGPEFRFGCARSGNLHTLQHLGAGLGFTADAVVPVALDGERVSSTRVRVALANADFDAAARLLGRPFTVTGHVVRGNQLGRTLGYPTANLRFDSKVPPLAGIFAAHVHGVGADPWPAVVSVGTRPTVGGTEPLLEAHLFGFDGDLYGQCISVEPIAKLRDEETFTDLPTMVAQMHRDASQARALLDERPRQAFA
jgi:riboflavin kinase/FMN adenylyltransferase